MKTTTILPVAAFDLRPRRITKAPVAKRTLACLLRVLLCVDRVRAEFLVIPDSRRGAAGGLVEVTLFVPNECSEELAYGESLIDHNRKVRSQLRIGLMISR